jgi:hypothetical protein
VTSPWPTGSVGSSCSNRGDDAYSDSHEEEKDNLTNEETLRFLSKMPHGVFQNGAFTVGPLGLRRSLNHRRIPGRRRGDRDARIGSLY